MTEIGRRTMLAVANMVVGVVFGLAAAKLIAIYWGPFYAGQVTYAMGVLGLFFFITDLGMGSAHVKHVSEGRDPGDCFATYTAYKVVATLVFIGVSLGVLFTYVVILGKPLESTTLPVFFISLGYYVAKSLQDIAQSSFDARLEAARSQLANFIDTVVRVGLTALGAIVVAALVHRSGPLLAQLDLARPIVAWSAANPGALLALTITGGGVAGAAVSLVMLFRSLERGSFRWDILRSYWQFALPLFVANTVWLISVNIDRTALGFFGGEIEAGIFDQVRRVPQVLAGVGTALGVLLFPAISAMAARADHDGIRDKMDRALRYLSMLLLPIVAFCVLFAADIIRIILSNEFLPGTTTLQILCVYTLLASLALPYTTLLFGMRRQREAAQIGVASALTVIGLDLVLIPDDIKGIPLFDLGLEGAAIATLVSGLVAYTGMRYYAAKRAGYRQRAHFLKHLVASVGMGGALLALDRYLLPLDRWYHFGVYAVVGLVVYLALLWALREFTRRDVEYVFEAIHPIEMLRYMWREITLRRR